MEYWESTKKRAVVSRPVWLDLTPDVVISKQDHVTLGELIDQFEPLVQERVVAQTAFDEAGRAVQRSLRVMRILGTKVPAIIEALLSENAELMKDVKKLYATEPRTEGTILKRARDLYPAWVAADALQAATVPPQAALTRKVAGTVYTAALLKGLVDGYSDVVKNCRDLKSAWNRKDAALRGHDAKVDGLIKRWYKVAKAMAEPETELAEALKKIPTEEGTPAPGTIEIASVTQGGEDGLRVVVAYVPGGGKHGTTKLIKWQTGTETNFPNRAKLEPGGNALGPFTEGAVVKIITETGNSRGQRTTAPRTITLGPAMV